MSKPTILIVEDEEIVAADLGNKLRQLGYEVCGSARRGEDAVALARERRPDLVLMDIRLAGAMDGVEAAEMICHELGLPVIYLTAHSDGPTLQRAKVTEPFGYILKPFETRELETHIEMALYKHKTERALRAAQVKLQAHADELEKTVARRTAKLQETVTELEHFSYAITHDMRAPLRAMQSFAGLLELECAGCECILSQTYFQRIKIASSRLDQLITDSLNYSNAIRQEFTLEPVDLDELLNGLVDTYPNLQSDKADIHLEANLPTVFGNQAALTQCFSNLLGNAVKFTKPGARPQIRVWAQEPSPLNSHPLANNRQQLRIWVEDQGIGIPQDSHQRIFGMFQRAAKGYDGTGIGLALVHKVIHRMGGEVGVESVEGQGSRFWVDLRRATQARSEPH
ncbi:MAG TPA: ATP-binding protein [Verrucomicrobiae bacterium]|nr:ATP-binding protein [Verrucomicrobiae bacterium]